MNPSLPRHSDERGAVLVIVALSITALLLFVALVIDLGATRSDRRGGQAGVDNAVAAATRFFAETEDVAAACETAFDYLALNLDVTAFTGDDCATVLSGACTAATTERRVTRSSDEFTAVFIHPVTDLSPLMDVSTIGAEGPAATEADDGPTCERVGLQITTTGDSFFGGIVGSDDRKSTVSAVGRADAGNNMLQALNLLALERHDCDTLTVGGSTTELIVATPVDDPTTPEDESLRPGIAASDSDARDCTGMADTVAANGGATILAQGPCPSPPGGNDCGILDLFATITDPTCSQSTDADQYACDEQTGSITPDATQLTEHYSRAPIDHRYNCKPDIDASLPSYDDEPWWTDLEQDIEGCENATPSTLYDDYVDRVKEYATTTAPTTFTVISGGDCNADTATYPPGNYYVDCGTFRVNSGAVVTFTEGNVVFRDRVSVQNGSTLELHACANTDPHTCSGSFTWAAGDDFDESEYSGRAAWAYAGGRVTVSGGSTPGTLRWNRTALFVGPGGDIQQSGLVIASAPEACDADPDCAGPFDDLGLWSEGTTSHAFRGGGVNDFQGLFFGGRAHFAMSGGTDVEMRSAQFVSNTMGFSGGVVFTMSPTGDRSVLFEVPASYSLIR